MIGHKFNELSVTKVKEGVERRLAYSSNLMMAVIDFQDGPKEQPDPPHSHPHEQVSYVAEGEVIFFMDGQQIHLCPGDMFVVPSGKPHSIQLCTEHARLVDCFTPLRDDFLE